MTRFVQKDLERRKVGIPLDQRGHWTEASERRGVEFPDRLRNPGAVVVDQDIHVLGDVMTSQMDLADRFDRECLEIADRVEPEIPRADVNVVDVAENAAAGSTSDFGYELRLRNCRMGVTE